MVMPPIRVWGNESPLVLKSMINDIDVFNNACSIAFGHTNTFREIRWEGKKRVGGIHLLSLAGSKIDAMLEVAGMVDLEEIRKITYYFADSIIAGE